MGIFDLLGRSHDSRKVEDFKLTKFPAFNYFKEHDSLFFFPASEIVQPELLDSMRTNIAMSPSRSISALVQFTDQNPDNIIWKECIGGTGDLTELLGHDPLPDYESPESFPEDLSEIMTDDLSLDLPWKFKQKYARMLFARGKVDKAEELWTWLFIDRLSTDFVNVSLDLHEDGSLGEYGPQDAHDDLTPYFSLLVYNFLVKEDFNSIREILFRLDREENTNPMLYNIFSETLALEYQLTGKISQALPFVAQHNVYAIDSEDEGKSLLLKISAENMAQRIVGERINFIDPMRERENSLRLSGESILSDKIACYDVLGSKFAHPRVLSGDRYGDFASILERLTPSATSLDELLTSYTGLPEEHAKQLELLQILTAATVRYQQHAENMPRNRLTSQDYAARISRKIESVVGKKPPHFHDKYQVIAGPIGDMGSLVYTDASFHNFLLSENVELTGTPDTEISRCFFKVDFEALEERAHPVDFVTLLEDPRIILSDKEKFKIYLLGAYLREADFLMFAFKHQKYIEQGVDMIIDKPLNSRGLDEFFSYISSFMHDEIGSFSRDVPLCTLDRNLGIVCDLQTRGRRMQQLLNDGRFSSAQRTVLEDRYDRAQEELVIRFNRLIRSFDHFRYDDLREYIQNLLGPCIPSN